MNSRLGIADRIDATPRVGQRRGLARAGGFTLIELLVVVAILTLLLSILGPAMSSVRQQVKGLRCLSNMKSIVFEFRLFAGGVSAGGRGDSETLGSNRFWIDDFQESLYGIDEFWSAADRDKETLFANRAMMLCPAGPRQLDKRRGLPCSNEAIGPSQDVSFALNMRMRRAAIMFHGSNVLAPVAATHVRSSVLDHPSVPLILDVDGREAARRGNEPFYVAPAIPEKDDPYSDGRYWTPSARHHGKTHVGFVGGHVVASDRPGDEPWDWAYQGDVGQ